MPSCPGRLFGLLAADGAGRIVSATALPNIAPARHDFLADPIAQFRAERSFAEAGLIPRAVYHSHPEGSAVPSRADHELAETSLVHLIVAVSGAGDDPVFRAYRREPGGFVPLPARALTTPDGARLRGGSRRL